jgi:class 3 adenylate cyclase
MAEDSQGPGTSLKEDDFQFRMDLVSEESEIVEETEEYTQIEQALKPNPERYDFVDDDDKEGWYDTHDNVFIPKEVLVEMWEEQAEGLPIYYSPDLIDDWEEYTSEKLSEFSEVFEKDGVVSPSSTDDDRFINYKSSLDDDDNPAFVIIKADLVASTKIAAEYTKTEYLRITNSFEYLVVEAIRKHRGFYLKKEGDGIYGFFPAPNLTGKHDNAALCALRILTLISGVLSKAMSDNGYPAVGVRIGLDSGRPEIVPDGDSSFDLMGLTMNLAAKMEGVAEPNEVVIGQLTERNLHTRYREATSEITNERSWDFSSGDSLYRIYSLGYPEDA